VTWRDEETASIGVVVLLGSWSMSFLALLFSLGIVRGGPSGWPPPALAHLPASLLSASVLVAVASSAALVWGLRAPRLPAVALGGALAVIFVIAQAGLLRALSGAGFDLREPPDAMVIALAGFHAVHAVIGAAGLAWAAGRAWARKDCAYGPLRRWAMFWHFVGAAWLAIYLAVFVA
jgi:heme/copper-type cytochrome/quinol oxidase subunit 3